MHRWRSNYQNYTYTKAYLFSYSFICGIQSGTFKGQAGKNIAQILTKNRLNGGNIKFVIQNFCKRAIAESLGDH